MNERNIKRLQVRESEGTIYALNEGQLKIGDIVLLSQSGVASWAIRTGTESNYSHAAILTRQGMLLEAQPEGVRRRSSLGTYATKREWITVLRPKFSVQLNTRGLSLAQCTESRYGWAYSKIRAIGSPWPDVAELASGLDGTFCSEMVALAYADYGVDLLPGVSRAAITPGMLKDSKVLSDVTASCVRDLHPVEDVDAYTLTVKVGARDEPAKEMKLERRCFDKLRSLEGMPPSARSLHDQFDWLASLDMTDKKNAVNDALAQDLLDQEGYFNFYENLAREIGFGAKPFIEALRAAQGLGAAGITLEIKKFQSELQEMLPTFEASFNARLDSYMRSQQLASNGSRTLVRLLDVHEQVLGQAAMLRWGRTGLVAELKLAAKR